MNAYACTLPPPRLSAQKVQMELWWRAGLPLNYWVVELRDAIVSWFDRVRGVDLDREGVLPTIGSKELLGLLPFLLGPGSDGIVVHPSLAYPAQDAGAAAVVAAGFQIYGLESGLCLWATRSEPAAKHILDRTFEAGAHATETPLDTIRR